MNYKKVPLFKQGITLIEMLIYIALLSLLLGGFINCAYAIHLQDIQLIDDINDAYVF